MFQKFGSGKTLTYCKINKYRIKRRQSFVFCPLFSRTMSARYVTCKRPKQASSSLEKGVAKSDDALFGLSCWKILRLSVLMSKPHWLFLLLLCLGRLLEFVGVFSCCNWFFDEVLTQASAILRSCTCSVYGITG